MHAASEWHYTGAGGEIQVHSGGIYDCGRRNNEADGWIAKDNAVLHELFRSVVTKRESSTEKPSVFRSVFVLILAYDLESWVMTEIISQVQVAERDFAMSPWCDTS